MLHLLQIVNASDVMVVVSRWYGKIVAQSQYPFWALCRASCSVSSGSQPLPCTAGGVLLGPARFQHINNAARELLERCGHIHTGPAGSKAKGKN